MIKIDGAEENHLNSVNIVLISYNKSNEVKMKTLILDGYFLLHRARSGFVGGPFSVNFMFFRSLRPLIEMHNPDRVYFVIEGKPKKRLAEDSNYKANRIITKDDPKYQKMLDFNRQKDQCIKLLKEYFPITVVQQDDFEADDIIAHLAIKNKGDEVIVVSSDTDFHQLLTKDNKHIKIYNPIKKTYVEPPDYDYVMWKAIRGDSADNIPGIPRHGDKTAMKIVRDPVLLSQKMKDEEWANHFHKNIRLIKFHDLTNNEEQNIKMSECKSNWNKTKSVFDSWEFNTMLKEKSWNKYVDTFENL